MATQFIEFDKANGPQRPPRPPFGNKTLFMDEVGEFKLLDGDTGAEGGLPVTAADITDATAAGRAYLKADTDYQSALVATRLAEALSLIAAPNAGLIQFATTQTTSTTVTVKTTTGYARLYSPDSVLGEQAGTGVAATSISLSIPAGNGVRNFTIMSVENEGSTRSGDITSIVAQGRNIVSLKTGEFATGLTTVNCASNPGLTKLPLWPAITSLTCSVCPNLSSEAMDEFYNGMAALAPPPTGTVVSQTSTTGDPTEASATARALLTGTYGWTIAF